MICSELINMYVNNLNIAKLTRLLKGKASLLVNKITELGQ